MASASAVAQVCAARMDIMDLATTAVGNSLSVCENKWSSDMDGVNDNMQQLQRRLEAIEKNQIQDLSGSSRIVNQRILGT